MMQSTIIISLSLIGIGLLVRAWKSATTPDLPLDQLKARWAKPPSVFVTLDGMDLHLRDEGLRTDPVPIVLLHGTGSSLHTWDHWVSILRPHRRLIRFDRPGFGLTGADPLGKYSMRFSAERLRLLMDHLGVSQAVIAGNSSGGRLAWVFATLYPQRVAALILLAPGGYPRSTPLPLGLKIARSRMFGPLLERILPRSQVRKGLEASFGDITKVSEHDVTRSYELTLRPGNRRALGETVRQTEAEDLSATIPKICAPTLILWGDKDTIIPAVPDATRFAHDISDSRLVMLPGVGHMPQEEIADESAAIIDEWLNKLGIDGVAKEASDLKIL